LLDNVEPYGSLEMFLDFTDSGTYYYTPLDNAVDQGNVEIVELLIHFYKYHFSNKNIKENPKKALTLAYTKCEYYIKLLRTDPTINKQDIQAKIDKYNKIIKAINDNFTMLFTSIRNKASSAVSRVYNALPQFPSSQAQTPPITTLPAIPVSPFSPATNQYNKVPQSMTSTNNQRSNNEDSSQRLPNETAGFNNKPEAIPSLDQAGQNGYYTDDSLYNIDLDSDDDMYKLTLEDDDMDKIISKNQQSASTLVEDTGRGGRSKKPHKKHTRKSHKKPHKKHTKKHTKKSHKKHTKKSRK
jgi:hypothetical protein